MSKSESKHTPGPWAVQYANNGNPYRIIRPDGDDKLPGSLGTCITRWAPFMCPSSVETLANARLIAAAPDLLECLIDFVKQWDDELEPEKRPNFVGRSRDAIALATLDQQK